MNILTLFVPSMQAQMLAKNGVSKQPSDNSKMDNNANNSSKVSTCQNLECQGNNTTNMTNMTKFPPTNTTGKIHKGPCPPLYFHNPPPFGPCTPNISGPIPNYTN